MAVIIETWYTAFTHYARRYMSNGMIHVQWSFREIARALNKFWLVESWFLDTRSSDSGMIFDQSESRSWRIILLDMYRLS